MKITPATCVVSLVVLSAALGLLRLTGLVPLSGWLILLPIWGALGLVAGIYLTFFIIFRSK